MTKLFLILRRARNAAVSKDEAACFETRLCQPLLSMRI
jgi:hypothetical protein